MTAQISVAPKLADVPCPDPAEQPRPDLVAQPEPTTAARRRLETLCDDASFTEFGSAARHQSAAVGMAAKRPAGDGVVTGIARIAGRAITVFAQDVSALGGSLGEVHAAKITRVLDHAGRARIPVVGLLDSGGARIQEGVGALDGYGSIFRRQVQLSRRVPQVSVILGACAGGAVYSPALTDIVIMAKGAKMFLTGPGVVREMTHEDVTAEELGGAAVHARVSGVVHLFAADEEDAMRLTAEVLGYLPDSCWNSPPNCAPEPPEPMPDVPTNHRKPYNVLGVVRAIVDGGSFLELQPDFAANIVIGFARVDGAPVGVVASQPLRLAGTLDIAASEKAARFVRLCDAFGLPLVTLVDTPGFLPGTKQEQGGIIRKGAKLLYAFAEATVPRVTLVLRKAFGGAYIVMNSRSLGSDAVFAWDQAELAVMGPEGAVDVMFRRDIAAEPQRRDELIAHYRKNAMASRLAAERMSVDEVVTPQRSRAMISATLRSLAAGQQPRYRHDNMPQ